MGASKMNKKLAVIIGLRKKRKGIPPCSGLAGLVGMTKR